MESCCFSPINSIVVVVWRDDLLPVHYVCKFSVSRFRFFPTLLSFSSLPTPTAVAGVEFSQPFVCLFIRTIPHKPTQPRSSNLTKKCSKASPGNLFILGSKGQGHESQRNICRRGSLHSCECWLLVVTTVSQLRYWRQKAGTNGADPFPRGVSQWTKIR